MSDSPLNPVDVERHISEVRERIAKGVRVVTDAEAKAVIDVLEILAKATDPQVALTDYVAATKAGDVEEMRRLLKGGAA